ncbi:hypothetical protein [Spiroplasma endosymbiont of Aspidapion aeneum]|uniref:hypothetical protein n=1 Tax=Spiroplasma endosymbiont of Aspidapion aeneum TaxID=3066276 RepID=UPI00313E132C
MNIIHIGAGNIGKGFIYPTLFDYNKNINFTFLDIDRDIINHLKNTNEYEVLYVESEQDEIRKYDNYKAFELDEIFYQDNLYLLKKVDLITTSIGKKNLKNLINWFKKASIYIEKKVVIMCCENGYKVSSYFENIIKNKNQNITFVDCLVDRIIPTQSFKDSNIIRSEKSFEWVCNEYQWPKEIQRLLNIKYVNNIDGHIYKKMCMLNGLHSSIAWQRYNIDKFMDIKIVDQHYKEWTLLILLKIILKKYHKLYLKNIILK